MASIPTSSTRIRGIDNVSNVSCHISCAIQILCHAIPPLRAIFNNLLEARNHISNDGSDESSVPNTYDILVNSLLDFLSPCEHNDNIKNSNAPSWNPRQLYLYLKQCHGIDYEQVGDPSVTLVKLLHLLRLGLATTTTESSEDSSSILQQSVWEGQTRQVLEGYRYSSNNNDNKEEEEECLCRIKTGKVKSMACPLVLRPSSDAKSDNHVTETVSIPELVHRISQPQLVQGSSDYPWDSLAPDTYTERIVVDDDDTDQCLQDVVRNEDVAVAARNTWITTKRIELHKIPRVWLLHVERPAPKDVMASLLLHHHNSKEGIASSLVSSVRVPWELDTASLQSQQSTIHKEDTTTSKMMILQGAILQVMEVEEDDKNALKEDSDNAEVHTVALLRCFTSITPSWILIDDETCEEVDEGRARRLLEGTVEVEESSSNNNNNGGGMTFYGATLLVYSVASVEDQLDWKEEIPKIQASVVPSHDSAQDGDGRNTTHPRHLVGRRLRIKWSKGKFYSGIVTKYDASSGKHQVLYDDGDVKEYFLAKKTVEWATI